MKLMMAGLMVLTVALPGSGQDERKSQDERGEIAELKRAVAELRAEMTRLRDVVDHLERLRDMTQPRMTCKLKDAEIRDVVALVENTAGVRVELPADLSGKITLSVSDVPWHEVLAVTVKTLGNYRVAFTAPGKLRVEPIQADTPRD